MVDLGYESFNSIRNLGSLSLLLCLYFLKLIYLLFLMILTLCSNKCQKHKNSLMRSVFFNELITLMIEGYYEFIISSYLQYNHSLNTTNGEILALYLSYVGIFISVILPLILIIIICMPMKWLKNPTFLNTFGAFFEGL